MELIMKKATVVINDYLKDFFDTISQFPTKDMDQVRQVVGHWPLVKGLIKNLGVQLQKEDGVDAEYAKTAITEFQQASTLLDKLVKAYDDFKNFDLEGIKTHTEPMLKLVEKVALQDEPADVEQPMENAEDEPKETEDMGEKMAKVASDLDAIANAIEPESQLVALALDQVSDVVNKLAKK
jgi:cytochrome c556